MNLQAIYSNIEKLQAACIDNGQSTSCSLLLGTWKGQYSTQKYRHNLQFSFSLSPWPIIQVDCFTILTKVKDTWGLRQIIGDSGILNLILPETLKLHKTCTNMDTCDGKRVKGMEKSWSVWLHGQIVFSSFNLSIGPSFSRTTRHGSKPEVFTSQTSPPASHQLNHDSLRRVTATSYSLTLWIKGSKLVFCCGSSQVPSCAKWRLALWMNG